MILNHTQLTQLLLAFPLTLSLSFTVSTINTFNTNTSQKVLPGGLGEFRCSPLIVVCVGSLWLLQLPSILQRLSFRRLVN